MPQVLLVDDRVENLGFVQDYLKSLGYTVDVALSGAQALEIMADRAPDIVFLDLEMPQMSGVEVLKIIRSTPAIASVPVAVLSAHPREDVEDECLEAGANHVLSKPIRLRLLREVVEALVMQS
jgi:CheY-like chemotaxis protein